MATRIRASCTECGDVELKVDDVSVRICIDDNAGTYVFRCPECAMAVVKDAEPRVVDLLVASGVSLVHWSLPAELRERPVGARFTHDDLLDFHDLLEGDAWMDALLGPTDGDARPGGTADRLG